MKFATSAALIVALAAPAALTLSAGEASANRIERACLQSDRRAASRNLCGCIQRVADQVLTGSDQRRAARFFTDPQRAQEVRKSDTPADDAFWQRWRDFGRAARNICG